MKTTNLTLAGFIRVLLEIPYKHRGRGYDGVDCYGLIIIFYRDFLGIELLDVCRDYDEDWAFKGIRDYFIENYHRQFEKVTKPKLYDIILFQNKKGIANHGGVVLQNGKFIHCSKDGVNISRYSEENFKRRFNGFYRYKNGL